MTFVLPKDDQTLLIVNCAKSWQEVEREQTYICPAEGSNYTYRPARYFGVYHNQKVSHIANIEAVVTVQPDETTQIQWLNWASKEAEYRHKALAQATRLRSRSELPVQVFILGIMQATNFERDSRGGMQGSKQYMDVSSLQVESAGYLAKELWDKKWSDIPSVTVEKTSRSKKNVEITTSGKYTPLQNWLLAQPVEKERLELSFDKIEEIISDKLPPSARQYPAWWLDKSANTSHVEAFSWLEADWQVEDLDIPNEKVSFVRRKS